MPLNKHEAANAALYKAMSPTDRIAFLVDRGIRATFDSGSIEGAVYRAEADGVGTLPVGLHDTEGKAILAGYHWLLCSKWQAEGLDPGEMATKLACREVLERLFSEIREAADAAQENGYHDAADHVRELLDALESGATAREITGGC